MWSRALVLAAVLLLNGCALFQKKRAVAAGPEQPRPVGTVTLVNDTLRFVLIDVGTLYTPLKGQALKTFAGSAETGVLAVSGEKRQPFIAADIVRGTPHQGDLVMQ